MLCCACPSGAWGVPVLLLILQVCDLRNCDGVGQQDEDRGQAEGSTHLLGWHSVAMGAVVPCSWQLPFYREGKPRVVNTRPTARGRGWGAGAAR